MATTKKQRQETVEKLTETLKGASGLVLAEYQGLKTQEFEELRAKLRPLKGECKIVKNTLTKRALKNMGLEEFNSFFKGQSALIIEKNDVINSTKLVVEFSKAHENLKIRGGVVDGRVMKSEEIKVLASLPPKEVLLARLLGNLKSPLSRLHGALTGPVRYLASALSQVSKKKESSGAA
ncbi:MAG TPA: 50S ribosomal protein L10 [Elusimicrobiota bacterium]|nr:50S ribosomal protein L10 [Elusimicrobiota bacterium]